MKVADDEGLEAIVDIDGHEVAAMDCFGYTCRINEGDVLDVNLVIGINDGSEKWDDIFSGNPERIKLLQKIEGWSYRAFGEIVQVNPVIVDCGIVEFEDVVSTHDQRCIGEFVAFNIKRLDIWAVR